MDNFRPRSVGTSNMDLQLVTASIGDLCRIEVNKFRSQLSAKNIDIFTNFDPEVDRLVVDHNRLSKMLEVVLTNAIKYTSQYGLIGIDIIGDTHHDTVHLTVWDSGKGFDVAELTERIKRQTFNRQCHELSGLNYVAKCAEMHEGTLSLQSTKGHGSRITISLPWVTSLSSMIDLKQAVGETTGKNITHILLVEDNFLSAQTMEAYLLHLGFEVTIAYDGADALKKAIDEKPDLIIMDIMLPFMSGLEAIRRIRAHSDRTIATIPIIALTALSMISDRQDCLKAGANDYISKPVSLRWLAESIRSQLTRSMKPAKPLGLSF